MPAQASLSRLDFKLTEVDQLEAAKAMTEGELAAAEERERLGGAGGAAAPAGGAADDSGARTVWCCAVFRNDANGRMGRSDPQPPHLPNTPPRRAAQSRRRGSARRRPRSSAWSCRGEGSRCTGRAGSWSGCGRSTG